MARRRWQNGSLRIRGGMYEGRWLEDVADALGNRTRIHKSKILGPVGLLNRNLAIRELQKYLAKVNDPNYQPESLATFKSFLDTWEQVSLPNMKPSTQSAVRSVIRKHLRPFFGQMLLSEIDGLAVQKFVSSCGRPSDRYPSGVGEMRANSQGITAGAHASRWPGGGSPTLSPKTIRNCVVTLRSIWRDARSWGLVSGNPFEHLRLPPKNPQPARCFTEQEVRLILDFAQEPYRTLYWFLAETGMRAGEICALRWEDVDLETNTVCVRRSTWRGTIQGPKTQASNRAFVISRQFGLHLREQFAADTQRNPTHILFESRKGTALDPNNVANRHLRPLLRKLGLQPGGLHAFRHYNATQLARLGVPIKTAQARLGHSSPLVTLQHYTHAIAGDDRVAAERLSENLLSRRVQ